MRTREQARFAGDIVTRAPSYRRQYGFLEYGFIAALVLGVGYLCWNNPSVSFRSSDGKWADSEVVFKGRTFQDVIVPEFERYKASCSAPKAKLLRTDPVIWYDVFAWPSYLTNPKWRVPYTAPNPALDAYHEDCARTN
jgi:hypothetical protein